MNMHGVMVPSGADRERPDGRGDRVMSWIRQRRVFLLLVALPSFLVAAYLYVVASDQYESEAHFLVRSASGSQLVPGGGMSQALSFVTGGSSGQGESMSVADYLTSHDVVATLRREDDLVGRFHRDGIDPVSRLNSNNPTPERLLRYFRRQVHVRFDTETNITTLVVRSFSPQDSYQLATKLLVLGERRVNLLNERSYNDAVASSRRQLSEAEDQLQQLQGELTHFRQSRGDVDPEASGKSQIGLVSTLTGELAAAKAQLSAMGSAVDHGSPQYRALSAHVAALNSQVAAQESRLTGGDRTIAGRLSGYQSLELRQQFLAKRYEAAAANLEKAREDARRQQLYVVRVVEPNLPVKSLFPERFRILFTVVVALMLIYSIGWLIAAGVREHAA